MSLAQGRHYLAIPGPSVIPDRVLQAMHRASPNIYDGPITRMVAEVVADLKTVAGTRHNVALYAANGHGVWEAALANTHARGDRMLVLATGSFAHGWANVADGLGLKTDILDFGRSAPVDPAAVQAKLEADLGREDAYRSVLVPQVDTSTSILNDIPAIRKAMDASGHPALLQVDCIASLGCDHYDKDGWGVDITVAACQKGLMTPPGMGMVYFNDRAHAARARADCVTHYWDWTLRAWPEEFYQYFDGTVSTHHIFGIREALDMIAEEGLDAIWARHDRLARAIWAAVETWGQGGAMRLNVADPDHRSRAVTTVYLGAPDGKRLRDWVTENVGVTLGIGLGMGSDEDPRAEGHFRIGHMGHVNAQMVMGALSSIDAGLKALDIPHGDGALSAASRVIAGV